MRTKVKALCAGATLLLSFGSTSAQNGANPIQDGLLRWYAANTVVTFRPCSEPEGLAFDGANVWVACGAAASRGNELIELSASDGTVIRTVPGIQDPYALVYDGQNLWASSPNNATVTAVRARDGFVLGTVPVGGRPMGMVFDGHSIWVANNSAGSNSISKVDPAHLTSVPYSVAPNCAQPWGLAFDGAYLWIACNTTNTVARFDTSTNTVTAAVPGIPFPAFVAYDGTNIWATSNVGGAKVYEFPASSPPMTTPPSFPVGDTSYGVAFDTQYVWVANAGSNNVTKLLASNGTIAMNYATVQSPPLSPTFVAFDGGNIWVSNPSGGSVSKF